MHSEKSIFASTNDRCLCCFSLSAYL